MLWARRQMLGLRGALKSKEKRSTPKRDLDFFLGFFLGFGWLSCPSVVSSCPVSSLKSLSTPDEPDGVETTDQLEEREWPNDCYVFEGKEKEPTIIYMPLFNRQNCQGLLYTDIHICLVLHFSSRIVKKVILNEKGQEQRGNMISV